MLLLAQIVFSSRCSGEVSGELVSLRGVGSGLAVSDSMNVRFIPVASRSRSFHTN